MDMLIALALLLLGLTVLAGDPPLAVVLLTPVWTVPLAWRRVHPLPAIAVVVAAVGAVGALYPDGPSQDAIPLALLVCAYTGGRQLDPPASWLGVVLVVGTLWLGQAAVHDPFVEFMGAGAVFGGVWAVGQAIRRRDREVAAARERETEAVREERTRIARELHDVVSHSLSVISIQTQAVRRRLAPGQELEAADLQAVERVTREAMAEMRRLFGVLRADGVPGSLQPQPGLGQLDALIGQAGLPVELDVRGEPQPLSPGVDLAAYRVVQEALTNARRHAGAQRVRVELVYGDPDLEITVTDDGRGPNGARPGHGLVGMRERVALYGGSLETGAREEGGYRLAARLPYRA
jgi:signal transduction histidine kinase